MSDSEIKKAYERMDPTPEAQDRMLAAILAANEAAAECGNGSEPAPAPDRAPAAKKRTPLLIALPIAACLAIIVGVGAFTIGGRTAGESSSNATDTAAAPLSASPAPEAGQSDATEPNGARVAESPARLFPVIELADGTVLRIAERDDGVLVPDETLAGESLGEAAARAEDGSSVRACTVYRYDDERYPYAIRYVGDPELYLAVADAGSSNAGE